MLIRNELLERTGDEELQLISLLAPEHARPHPSRIRGENGIRRCGPSTTPIVHRYRNIFSHVPSTKVREIAAMLKAIHASEDVVWRRAKMPSE
jgi:hypothetical protein